MSLPSKLKAVGGFFLTIGKEEEEEAGDEEEEGAGAGASA